VRLLLLLLLHQHHPLEVIVMLDQQYTDNACDYDGEEEESRSTRASAHTHTHARLYSGAVLSAGSLFAGLTLPSGLPLDWTTLLTSSSSVSSLNDVVVIRVS
jgi:hypothetical protein